MAGFVGTANLIADGDGLVTVRPERIRLGAPTGDEVGATGTVDAVQYLGATTRYRVHIEDGTTLVVEVPNTTASPRVAVGDTVRARVAHRRPPAGGRHPSAPITDTINRQKPREATCEGRDTA